MSIHYKPIKATAHQVGPMFRSPRYVTHAEEFSGPEMVLAEKLVEKWGMVAAFPHGEDSAGRQRLRIMTPIEVADRALETAQRLVEAGPWVSGESNGEDG